MVNTMIIRVHSRNGTAATILQQMRYEHVSFLLHLHYSPSFGFPIIHVVYTIWQIRYVLRYHATFDNLWANYQLVVATSTPRSNHISTATFTHSLLLAVSLAAGRHSAVTGTFAPKNFRSRERKYHGVELSLLKIFRSLELLLPG